MRADKSVVRVAFSHISGKGWSAGLYYLKNLFWALKSKQYRQKLQIILVTDMYTESEEFAEFSPLLDEVLEFTKGRQSPEHAPSRLYQHLLKKTGLCRQKQHPLSVLLNDNRIDAFFALGEPPAGFEVPFLSWIPDFQHLHYPEFFSDRDIKGRNASFQLSAENASKVILSSRDAYNDFVNFAPESEFKAEVLPFVAQIPMQIYDMDSQSVCSKYHIPKRYILVPNQFWIHKNHEVVIKALERAIKENSTITIVCTGCTHDFRNLNYFNQLLCNISAMGLRDKMIILGLVPREDLFLLMRQALAVLQPSLFEGWNTTVEEVKSLGKRIILSDIKVHREQNPPAASYFKPNDVEQLAAIIIDEFSNRDPGPDLALEQQAAGQLQQRTERFGERFLDIVIGAVS
jgi:glycosyltransferase involved in cell wall biosynthesis